MLWQDQEVSDTRSMSMKMPKNEVHDDDDVAEIEDQPELFTTVDQFVINYHVHGNPK